MMTSIDPDTKQNEILNEIVDLKIDGKEDMVAELEDAKSKLAEYQQLAKAHGIDLTIFVPKKVKYSVSFKLLNSCVGVADALRRSMCSELPIVSMICKPQSISSNCPFIKVDKLSTAIEAIPFQQDDIDGWETWEAKLECENTTSRKCGIYSRHITVYNKEGKVIPDLFEDCIKLD